MKFPSFKTNRQILGLVLIIVAVALLIYDFFSPPVGELSNFTLIVFAKLIAIAGSLLNINININQSKSLPKDEEI
ncbi:MAG: hypothetical protein K2H38_10410 [Muribaculaceae bacterium]|nr:hypothetical protein [Muribaculaceae bacterium]